MTPRIVPTRKYAPSGAKAKDLPISWLEVKEILSRIALSAVFIIFRVASSLVEIIKVPFGENVTSLTLFL